MLSKIPVRSTAPVLDLLNFIGRQVADQQLHCVMTFLGRVDELRLAEAVRLTLDAEPILGCRFVEGTETPYWERCEDLDSFELLSVEETEDVDQAAISFMARPIDPYRDPKVQVRVFRSSTDTVCVKVDHLAADAGGCKEYVYLLASIYRRLAEDPGYTPKPNVAGDRGLSQVFQAFSPEQLRLVRPSPIPPPSLGFPSVGQDRSERTFAIRRIGAARFRALKQYGREHGATVNDLLLAALYRALFEVCSPESGSSLTIQVPVDLRRYLPSGKAGAICNLSGASYPAIALDPDESFEQTLSKVIVITAAIKADNPGLDTAVGLEYVFKDGYATGRGFFEQGIGMGLKIGRFHPYLSNLGILGQQQLDFGDGEVIDAFLVGPVLFAPAFMLACSTFKDVLTLTIGYSTRSTLPGAVGRVLESLLDALPGL